MPFHLVASKGLSFFCLVNYQKASYLLLPNSIHQQSLDHVGSKNSHQSNYINLHHRLNVREAHHGRGVNEDINSRKTDTTSSSSVQPRHRSNIRFAVAAESTKPGINVVRTNINGTTTSKVILEDNEANEANDHRKRADSKA